MEKGVNPEKVTIQLPITELDFLRQYAQKHRVTVPELIERYARNLKAFQKHRIHPDVEKITGILPKDIDVKDMFYQYTLEKHS